MWGVDNEIRGQIKQLTQIISDEDCQPAQATALIQELLTNIREMVYKEEKILFPEALLRLSEKEWAEIREQEEEIGYFDIKPDKEWQPVVERVYKQINSTQEEPSDMNQKDLFHLDTGELSIEQINLMLTNLPVDVTFVDEKDEVRYFSQGKDRIFQRSPAIIGRAVTKCHPPQSVHRVEIILNDFRSGKRDVAEFWIQAEGQFIHIRYFALRDKENKYKGCIEVSQNATHIRALEGEQRLLDDAPGYAD